MASTLDDSHTRSRKVETNESVCKPTINIHHKCVSYTCLINSGIRTAQFWIFHMFKIFTFLQYNIKLIISIPCV